MENNFVQILLIAFFIFFIHKLVIGTLKKSGLREECVVTLHLIFGIISMQLVIYAIDLLI